jgi:hypothetical protein
MAKHFDVFSVEQTPSVQWKVAAEHKIAGHIKFQGLSIAIENPKGSVRKWHDKFGGEHGQTKMAYHYGFIKRTDGADGEEIDVYVGPNEDAKDVFVIRQMRKPSFMVYDEDKVMIGFDSAREAKAAYLMHYNDKRFFGSMSEMTMAEFKSAHVNKSFAKSTGWLGVDLDGTLAEFGSFKGKTVIGKPIPAMVEKVKAKLAAGKTVKIFTARVHDGDKETISAIEQWCEQHLGRKLPVTNKKDPDLEEIWDDIATGVKQNTGQFVKAVLPNDIGPTVGVQPAMPLMPGMMNPMNPMGMMGMGPPPIDVETLEGVQGLLGRIGSVPDQQLIEIASKIWGDGYTFEGQKPEQARQEIIGFLLDQQDLLGIKPDPALQPSPSLPVKNPDGSTDYTSPADQSLMTWFAQDVAQ